MNGNFVRCQRFQSGKCRAQVFYKSMRLLKQRSLEKVTTSSDDRTNKATTAEFIATQFDFLNFMPNEFEFIFANQNLRFTKHKPAGVIHLLWCCIVRDRQRLAKFLGAEEAK